MNFIEEYKKEFVQALIDIKLWFCNPLRNKKLRTIDIKTIVYGTIIAVVIYIFVAMIILLTGSKEGAFIALNVVYAFVGGFMLLMWYVDLADKKAQDE